MPPARRDELERALAEGDDDAVQETIVALTLHDADGTWVQDHCLALKDHPSWQARATAMTCLGHIARIHRSIDIDRVLPPLRSAMSDPRTAGYAEQAIEDIEIYVGFSADDP